ncbi:MAG TPA: SDR family oxidoreductase [Gaiellaceae bacterium]|nr:SDR family oxidoreductase [Gaiellaceae bacterium]
MSESRFSLDGRTAVVTGASSGLGARFAAVLAEAGADVVAAARRIDRLEELAAAHPAIHPFACDVTDDDGPERLVREALDRFGRVDVCVNNAGISSGGPERQATLDGFRSVLRVNLEALFAVSQAVAVPMREQRGGSVVNVSSMFGSVAAAPVPDAGYVASKSAVNGLTRELAAQWAPDGVRVNAIAPGWFPSEMTAELLADEKALRWFERQCPLGRPGRVDELDGALLFLASDASSYCTGQVLTVDGGWTIR